MYTRGGRAAHIIPPSGEKHIKKKRKTTQRLSFPPLLLTPPPLDLWDKIEKKIRQKEKERKRKALKPPDLSKLLRLSAKITSAGYLLALQISCLPPPPLSPLKWCFFIPLFYFLIIFPLCSLLIARDTRWIGDIILHAHAHAGPTDGREVWQGREGWVRGVLTLPSSHSAKKRCLLLGVKCHTWRPKDEVLWWRFKQPNPMGCSLLGASCNLSHLNQALLVGFRESGAGAMTSANAAIPSSSSTPSLLPNLQSYLEFI